MRSIRPSSLIAVVAVLALVAALLTPEAQGVPAATRLSVATDGTQGNGASADPSISSDSNLTAFESSASNLVPGDASGFQDIFVRNRLTNQTERVSVSDGEAEANAASANPDVSSTGQFVAFDSAATNLTAAADAAAFSDVFRRDRINGTTVLLSQSSGGTLGNAASTDPFISGDGRYGIFTSAATNLVAADADAATTDVFWRDVNTNTTELVSQSDADAQSTGADTGFGVTDDGNQVLFVSNAMALTTTPTADGDAANDLFVRNRSAASTEIVSVSSDETKGNGASPAAAEPATASGASLSANGNLVAFSSDATNLVSGDANGASDIFVRNRSAGTTTRVSVDSGERESNGASTEPVISPDGRLVAFTSAATNLIAGDTNGVSDVFVRDLTTGKTFRLSEGSQLTGASATPTLASSTTPFGAFASSATNAVSGDTNGVSDVFLRTALEARGYLILDDAGGFFTFGDAQFFGSVPGLRNSGVSIGQADVIDMAVTPTGSGYLALDEFGGIFSFGDAVFKGSVPGLRQAGTCTCPANSLDIAITSTGQGYYILDALGGIFTFGDATFFGSLPQLRQQGANVGPARAIDIAVTPTGAGYWILDEAGGVFSFGDAQFFGSVPGLRQAGVQIGQAAGIRFEETPSGLGYLVLDSLGGIFTFGDARFFGSVPGLRNAGTVIGPAFGVDFALTPSGEGYHILDDQGGIFTFGDATFFGSVPQLRQQGVNIGPASSVRIDTVA